MKTTMTITMTMTMAALLAAPLAACSAGGESGVVGSWVGYVDMRDSALSSDRIELEVTELAEDGTITGRMSFGEPGTLPPPTDPDLGYPEGFVDDIAPADYPFVEKFTYTFSGTFDTTTGRLLGERNIAEPWDDWCLMQTPHIRSGSGWGCLPSCGGMGTPDGVCTISESCEELPGAVVDCAKVALCGAEVCQCDATGCEGALDIRPTVDLHLDGDELSGPVEGLGLGYLTRQ